MMPGVQPGEITGELGIAWKGVGNVANGVAAFYRYDGRGGRNTHEETQLRGAAFSLFEMVRDQGPEAVIGRQYAIQTEYGTQAEIMFEQWPLMAVNTRYCWVPLAMLMPN